MSKQDRDILDEMFRAKLYDHEVDTTPEDWEMIASRLPESKPVVHTLRRRWLYWSAAAIVTGLVMTTSLLFLNNNNPEEMSGLADKPKTEENSFLQKEEIASPVSEVETPLIAANIESEQIPTSISGLSKTIPSDTELNKAKEGIENAIQNVVANPEESEIISSKEEVTKEESRPVIAPSSGNTLIADAGHSQKETSKAKTRRWGFGMGGGSMSMNSQNTYNGLVHTSPVSMELQRDDDMMIANAPLKTVDYETDHQHKTPVSFGLSASYYLNNRWAIQAGLSYSLLVSETKQNTLYHRDEEQRLHFIGIPISLSYKIAEWNAFQVYAAAGFTPEINVAGKYKVKKWADGELTESTTSSVRMRELYWSVNARGGVSYPVFKYMNAFAEVGAAYYFDNNSSIQTIHSEKPFNVSFNFGLRFGF